MTDEDWKAIKDAKKFPEAFKPLIHTMGQKAVELGLIGDALYDVLPFVIRYNRFTMKASLVLPPFFDVLISRAEIHARQVEGLPDRILSTNKVGTHTNVEDGNR